MIETLLVDLPQFNAYHYSVSPIVYYHKENNNSFPNESEIDKLLLMLNRLTLF